MRIAEALEELEKMRRRGPGMDVFRREARHILNEVWLEAYEEGKASVFEPLSEDTTVIYESRPR